MKSNKMGSKCGRVVIGALFIIMTAAWTARGISPDAYEPDNAWTNASTLAPSAAQDHTIHVTNDLDYTAFSAQAGHVYRMETYDLSANLDTYMYL